MTSRFRSRWRARWCVAAAHIVEHPPDRVYAFLATLENHRRLGDASLYVEALAADRAGGRVVLAGPAGVRRSAETRVTTARRPWQFGGTAKVGRRTRAYTAWSIEPAAGGALVSLQATVVMAGALDLLLWSAGGRWWLRRRFERILVRLSRELDRASML